MQHPVSDTLPAAHLDAERLAALADESPTAGEAAHLGACPACRDERDAYVALVSLARAEGAGDRPADVYAGAGSAVVAPHAGTPDDGAWHALAAALRAEGLSEDPRADVGTGRSRVGAGGAAPRHRPTWAGKRRARAWIDRPLARIAAGVALVVGAATLGRLSATRSPLPATNAAVATTAAVGATAAAGADAFASIDDARTALARARRDYARAAAFLATADPTGADGDAMLAALDAPAGADEETLRARLATLDALLPRVRAAVREAPEDPAVNQLYLSAYDARETALRELGRTLPAGVQLTGY
jgi:hypothetical protein